MRSDLLEQWAIAAPEIAEIISSGITGDRLAQELSNGLRPFIRHDELGIHLLRDGAETWDLMSTIPVLDPFRNARVRGSRQEAVLREIQPSVENDILQVPGRAAMSLRHLHALYGIRASATAPLWSDGRGVGTISFGARVGGAFSPEAAERIGQFAELAAPAFERLVVSPVSANARVRRDVDLVGVVKREASYVANRFLFLSDRDQNPISVSRTEAQAAVDIVRESARNARRHAGARSVTLRLDSRPRSISVTVADDGGGFDPDRIAVDGQSSGGLAGMHRRAADAGGALLVVTGSAGTRVSLLLPTDFAREPESDLEPESDVERAHENRIRIVIADHQDVARLGLWHMLAGRAIDLVGSVESSDDLRTVVRDEQPDVVLLDLGITGPKLAALLAELRELQPNVGFVLTTSTAEAAVVAEAFRSGVRAHVPKAAGVGEFADAIERVARGHRVIPPSVEEHLLQPRRGELTAREVEVLALVADGNRNKEVARRLGLQESTVKFHLASAFRKLGSQSRTEAVRAFLQGRPSLS